MIKNFVPSGKETPFDIIPVNECSGSLMVGELTEDEVRDSLYKAFYRIENARGRKFFKGVLKLEYPNFTGSGLEIQGAWFMASEITFSVYDPASGAFKKHDVNKSTVCGGNTNIEFAQVTDSKISVEYPASQSEATDHDKTYIKLLMSLYFHNPVSMRPQDMATEESIIYEYTNGQF